MFPTDSLTLPSDQTLAPPDMPIDLLVQAQSENGCLTACQPSDEENRWDVVPQPHGHARCPSAERELLQQTWQSASPWPRACP